MDIRTSNNPAKPASAFKISAPKIDSEEVADKAWGALDSFEKIAGRTGYALGHGVGAAIPLVGYNLSKHIRRDFQNSYSDRENSVNRVSNAVTGLAQMGGMVVGGAAVISSLAGSSMSEALWLTTAGLFGTAGLSAVVTTFATDRLEQLTQNF